MTRRKYLFQLVTFIGITLVMSAHLIRDFLQILGVEIPFTTLLHSEPLNTLTFWHRFAIESAGIIIQILVITFAIYSLIKKTFSGYVYIFLSLFALLWAYYTFLL